VLSKIDLWKTQGKLPFRVEFYATLQGFPLIMSGFESQNPTFSKKFGALNKKLIDVLEEYSMVQFYPLDIFDKISVSYLVGMIDRANGFFYTEGTEVDCYFPILDCRC
jgi:hypothetical protein